MMLDIDAIEARANALNECSTDRGSEDTVRYAALKSAEDVPALCAEVRLEKSANLALRMLVEKLHRALAESEDAIKELENTIAVLTRTMDASNRKVHELTQELAEARAAPCKQINRTPETPEVQP